FATRRQIAALSVIAGKAKSHRDDRDSLRVIENVVADPAPAFQPRARSVVIGPSRRVNPRAGRLARDADARFACRLNDRPRFVWQGFSIARRVATDAASANVPNHFAQSVFHSRPTRPDWRIEHPLDAELVGQLAVIIAPGLYAKRRGDLCAFG